MTIEHWFTGVIENINDPMNAGRVQLRCFEYHSSDTKELPTADLPWAFPMMPLTSAGVGGVGTSPTGLQVGSWVLGFFRDPDNQDPVIIGCVPGMSPPTQTAAVATAPNSVSGNTGKVFTGSAKEYYDKVYKAVYAAAVAQGLPNPEVIASLGAAQSSLETGWGKHLPPGSNNAFGIKGTGPVGSVNIRTREVINGQSVYINDNFRAYNSFDESASDYVNFLSSKQRYSGVISATDINSAVDAIGKSGYATDPKYGSQVGSIVSRYGN